MVNGGAFGRNGIDVVVNNLKAVLFGTALTTDLLVGAEADGKTGSRMWGRRRQHRSALLL